VINEPLKVRTILPDGCVLASSELKTEPEYKDS